MTTATSRPPTPTGSSTGNRGARVAAPHNRRGRWLTAAAVLVMVALVTVIVLGLAQGGGHSLTNPIQLYPERGKVANVVSAGNGYACVSQETSATLKMGGTVDLNGTLITMTQASKGVQVAFQGTIATTTAIAKTSDGSTPAVIPQKALGNHSPGLLFAKQDFGEITGLTLCGP